MFTHPEIMKGKCLATSAGSLLLILRVELVLGPTRNDALPSCPRSPSSLSLSYLLLSAFPATEQSQRLSPPSRMKPPRRCPPCFSFPRPRQGSPPSFPKRRPAKDRASLAAPPRRTATPRVKVPRTCVPTTAPSKYPPPCAQAGIENDEDDGDQFFCYHATTVLFFALSVV
jgi:hypothetical protein